MAINDLVRTLRARGAISAHDVLALRRAVFSDDGVAPDEAEMLFDLDEADIERALEWKEFFVEAITDIVVRQQRPAGYVLAEQAAWLMKLIDRDGRTRTDSELELLVRILEAAQAVPPALVTFTLGRIQAAVLDGDGPLFRDGDARPGRITAGEVALLRRVLYAAAGDDDLAITRAEAEILFDINDACRGADNDPAWIDLFSKALAASVMSVSGYEPPSRHEAARRQAWLESPHEGLGGFMGRMFGAAPGLAKGGVREALKSILESSDPTADWRAQNDAEGALSRAAEAVTRDEAAWLVARIGRDGDFDAAERAVIEFLRRESPLIDPALRPLLDAA